MRVLVSVDNWLDPAYAVPDARHYRQFLLYADPDDRFSVVSFVCAPGQATPIHDHTVWGVIGVLRGAEIGQYYMIGDDGRPFESRAAKRFEPGDIAFVSPSIGDIHMIRNAFDDRASVSIHVYGGNIGRIERALYFPEGHVKRFMSGYTVPGTAGD
jgi:predicted metal-dependent enzyme (double-stranded beta helix superfamily)